MRGLLILVLIALEALPSFAATSGTIGSNLSYTLSDDGKLVISGKGEMSESPFTGNESIKSVVIEDGVTSICYRAFYRCSALTSASIPSSVTSIGEDGFCRTGLTSIVIPEGMKILGDYCFQYCDNLTSVEIPN